MEYLTRNELRRLFTVAFEKDKRKHLLLITGFWHALRISEALAITDRAVQDGQLSVQRLKGSKQTIQPVHRDPNPVFDCSPLLTLVSAHPDGKLFPWTRQWVNKFIVECAKEAGVHRDKAYFHAVAKHSMGMLIFGETLQLGQVQSYLGHVSPSSTLAYLHESDHSLAQRAVARIAL